jgi:PAT family beta-lactamase induction signal transducer AmpG
MHLPNLLYVWIAWALPQTFFGVETIAFPVLSLPAFLGGADLTGPFAGRLLTLGLVVFIEAFGYGFGFAGYFVYLMFVAQRGKFVTSHYAIGTGLGALFITFAIITAGIIESVFGYLGVFIAACLFTIPGTLILLFIPLDETEGRGIKAEAEH